MRTDRRTGSHDETNNHFSNFCTRLIKGILHKDLSTFMNILVTNFVPQLLRIVIDNNRCGSIIIVSNMPYFLNVILYVHFCVILFSMLPPHIGPFYQTLMTDKRGATVGS